MSDIIKKLELYLNNIKSEDKIIVIYHGFCGDGVCSAVITIKSLERILKRKVDFHFHSPSHEINKELLDLVIKNKIKKVIFVDLYPNYPKEAIKELENYSDILVIDHHQYHTDINSEKTLFIHSSFLNKEIQGHNYPASKLTFDLFSKLTDIEDLDYLACMGLIVDMGYRQWKDFINQTMKKYNINSENDLEKDQSFDFKNPLGFGATAIQLSKRFKDNVEEVFKEVYNSENYKDIINNKILLGYKKKINDEIQFWLKNSDRAEKHGNLIIYEIKSKYNISTTISSVLSIDFFPGKTIIVIREGEEDPLTISARDQKINIKVNKLLEKAAQGIKDANVGGHEPAAGGRIKKEYLGVFKKNLIKAYKELSQS